MLLTGVNAAKHPTLQETFTPERLKSDELNFVSFDNTNLQLLPCQIALNPPIYTRIAMLETASIGLSWASACDTRDVAPSRGQSWSQSGPAGVDLSLHERTLTFSCATKELPLLPCQFFISKNKELVCPILSLSMCKIEAENRSARALPR